MISDDLSRYLDYALRRFPTTLEQMVLSDPSPGRAHLEADGGLVLQPHHLGLGNPVIRELEEPERSLLAATLCWVVSLDEWMWSHGRDAYPEFRELTRFPKLVGECKSACRTHQDPTTALRWVGGEAAAAIYEHRFALAARIAPVIGGIVRRVAQVHHLPELAEIFRLSLADLKIRERDVDSARVDSSIFDGIGDWRMPVLARDQLGKGQS